MSDKLTVEKLSKMKPHEIIAKGIIDDKNVYDKPIRWVAKRGYVNDWVIYYGEKEKTEKEILARGFKLVERKFIEKLVPCTTEAYKKYRY